MSLVREKTKHRSGFWARQFSTEPTRLQRIYDVLFGIIAPILCFWFDPLVFQNSLEPDEGLIGRYKFFVYSSSVIAIITLSLWLLYGTRLRRSTSVIGSILFSGAVLSGSIGGILLPFSIVGLFLFIGFFGFIPFFTSFTYWRNGFRALQQGKLQRSFILSFILGVILIFLIPANTDFILSRLAAASMKTLVSKDSTSSEKDAAVKRIKWLRWYIEAERIKSDYYEETDEVRKENIAIAYRVLTNRDINASRGD